MTNFDIATACATRPEDRARQVENQILNAFEARLKELRADYAPNAVTLENVELAHLRNKIRATAMATAIGRVITQLKGSGIDNYLLRSKPDGWHHTVDPLTSFSVCSTCGGSTTYAPPCSFQSVTA